MNFQVQGDEMKKTALHDIHVKLNAKMVPFAGYEMPIQYHSIRAEHRRVRETVGVFDVSHMGEIEIRGKCHQPCTKGHHKRCRRSLHRSGAVLRHVLSRWRYC